MVDGHVTVPGVYYRRVLNAASTQWAQKGRHMTLDSSPMVKTVAALEN